MLFNFNMFRSQKRQVKEADYDPGIEDMMHLAKMQRLNARLPPPQDIASAMTTWVEAKSTSGNSDHINDTHIRLLTTSLKYCLEAEQTDSSSQLWASMSKPTLLARLAAKLEDSCGRSKVTHAHIHLAQLLLDAAKGIRWRQLNFAVYNAYAAALSFSGQAQKARQFVLNMEEEFPLPMAPASQEVPLDSLVEESVATQSRRTVFLGPYDRIRIWCRVLRGFALEDNEAELLATADIVQNLKWHTHSHIKIALIMLTFYLHKNDAKAVKTWFDRVLQLAMDANDRDIARAEKPFSRILLWCLQNGELEYGQGVVRKVMEGNPSKRVWDAVFIWAAGNGKGADEIGRMFDVMEKSNEEIANPDEWRLPDIGTINALVEYATSKADPYLAERFIALGKDRGIQPDAKTYQLQVEYRLKIKDVDGALLAYKNLQAMDLSSNEDVPIVNQLIVELCRTKRHDFETVMNVAMDLSDRRVRFEPETVATLALLHLSRDEYHDVVDLLNTHSHHFASEERDAIRNQILAYCLDPQTPTPRSWDAYNVLRNTFDEMPRTQRTEILTNFFHRERPDMAVHVFTEMRRHSRMDAVPTAETYVASFLGSAKLRHLQSLEVIHNQLKLDYTIDLNTHLRNAMMIAYIACRRPRQALGFWEDIIASKEGPTYNSIHIALRACEKAAFGDVRAKDIWAKLRKMKVDLDQSLWASYAAALAGNGDNDLAITTVEEAEKSNEVEVDAFLLGSLLSGANNEAKQAEIESWAAENYPAVWEELQKIGYEENDLGKKIFKVDRSVTP